MIKKNIIGMNEEELKGYCRTLGFRDYHGKQIFNWIYKKFPSNFQEMTDISLELRKYLDESFSLEYLPYSEKYTSIKEDATKYCFRLADDVSFESVALRGVNNRTSFCISSQAGCPIGCIYCATGKMGFLRNLLHYEIIGQVLAMMRLHPKPNSILFMGMGEPLLNLENVSKSILLLNAIGINSRKIIISTCGPINAIYRLAKMGLSVRLAVSIGSAIEEKRKKIIPIANKNSLMSLHKALIFYRDSTKRRVSIEYTIIQDLNDTEEDADALALYAKTAHAHVNLIRFNPVRASGLKEPDYRTIRRFKDRLRYSGVEVTERFRKGRDISAACGQLATGQL
jgi:23S rRNA (adenine2503-C2)-methyltransferase